MQQFIAAANITPNDVAVCWIVNHPALNEEDAVISGPRKNLKSEPLSN